MGMVPARQEMRHRLARWPRFQSPFPGPEQWDRLSSLHWRQTTLACPGLNDAMKTSLCAAVIGSIAIFAFGCKKEQPKAIKAEQVPAEIETAFKTAKPEASAAAQEIVTSVRADNPHVLLDLQDLAARSDVTAEQRAAANRAQAAMHTKLLEA